VDLWETQYVLPVKATVSEDTQTFLNALNQRRDCQPSLPVRGCRLLALGDYLIKEDFNHVEMQNSKTCLFRVSDKPQWARQHA
jgi:hypothetical protein